MLTFDEYFKRRAITKDTFEHCGGTYGEDSLYFNVYDYAARPEGYIERRLNSDPRFVNGLTSSDTLYPIHVTAPYIAETGEAIVVEGPSDSLSIYQSGYKNVVSFQGASNFGKRKLRILRRFCSSIWFIFDRDEAGLQFHKYVRYRLDLDFPIYMSFPPVGLKDPAEYLADGNSLSELSKYRVP